MCRGQFLENGWKKQNAIYRDSSTAHAEFKSTNRSKIGSLYEEIFQHKGTVPNDQIDPISVLFLYYNHIITTHYNQWFITKATHTVGGVYRTNSRGECSHIEV